MDDRHPHVDFDREAEGYAGERCEVCGKEPAMLRVRWWEQARRGAFRLAGSMETHYFCDDHRDQADEADRALQARSG